MRLSSIALAVGLLSASTIAQAKMLFGHEMKCVVGQVSTTWVDPANGEARFDDGIPKAVKLHSGLDFDKGSLGLFRTGVGLGEDNVPWFRQQLNFTQEGATELKSFLPPQYMFNVQTDAEGFAYVMGANARPETSIRMGENWQHIHQKFASLDLFRNDSDQWFGSYTKSGLFYKITADVACQKNDESSASLVLYTLKDLQQRIKTELEGGELDELGNVPKQGDAAG